LAFPTLSPAGMMLPPITLPWMVAPDRLYTTLGSCTAFAGSAASFQWIPGDAVHNSGILPVVLVKTEIAIIVQNILLF